MQLLCLDWFSQLSCEVTDAIAGSDGPKPKLLLLLLLPTTMVYSSGALYRTLRFMNNLVMSADLARL